MVVSLSMFPFVTSLTLPLDKLTLKSLVASFPVDVPRISIELGVLVNVAVTVTTVPIFTPSLTFVVSVSADHTGGSVAKTQ